MKVLIDMGFQRRTVPVEDEVTVTGTTVVSGDTVIAEIGMLNGQVCWFEKQSSLPIGYLAVKP